MTKDLVATEDFMGFTDLQCPLPPHPGPLPRGEGVIVSRLLKIVRGLAQSSVGSQSVYSKIY